MGSVSRGKQFEQQIKRGFEKQEDTFVFRLKDDMSGFAKISNPCDFIVFHKPLLYLLECKETKGNTLNFKSDIRPNQWEGLIEYSGIDGVVTGYMVWFIDHDLTIFVEASEMKKLLDNGDKSLNCRNLPDHFVIDGKKKRVLFDYDMSKFINRK